MKESGKYHKIIKLLPYFLLGITVVVFYFVHVQFVFSSDDLYYMTNLATGEPLQHISEIYESQVWHYFNWGGRTVAHALLQATLLTGETYANVINILCTALLVYLMLVLSKHKNMWNYLLILSFLILCNPNWAQTLFWEAGFANYVYTTIIALSFLLVYINKAENPERKSLIGIDFWIAPLGLLAGWTNENIGPALFVCTLGIIIYIKRKKYKTPAWMWLGNLFSFLGSLLIIMAPGNQVRVDTAYSEVEYGTLIKVLLRFYHMGVALYHYLFPILLVLFLVLFMYIVMLKMKLKLTDVVLLSMAVLSVAAMFLSPHYPDRAAFGTIVCIIIVIMRMFGEIMTSFKVKNIYIICFTLFMWIGMIFTIVEHVLNVLNKIPLA